MKRLFSSSQSAEIGHFASMLETAGIECEIRNEFLSQAMPGISFDPEIWVLRDEDYLKATELLADWRSSTVSMKP